MYLFSLVGKLLQAHRLIKSDKPVFSTLLLSTFNNVNMVFLTIIIFLFFFGTYQHSTIIFNIVIIHLYQKNISHLY